MTVVGKILVFLNLVFSLLVGGLVILAYSARQNWQLAHKKEKEVRIAVERSRDQIMSEKQKTEADYAQRLQASTDAVKALRTQLTDKDKEIATLNDQMSERKQAVDKSDANTQGTQAASDSRAEEVKGLETALTTSREQVKDLNIQLRTERADKVRAQIESRTTKARVLEMEEEIRRLARLLAKSKTAGVAGTETASGRRDSRNPPPEDLEGRVVQIDSQSSLMTIKPGSDAGLERGHTLEVFRLGPKPRYLGTVRIESVRPHEAVARPIKRMPYPVRVGDRVASRIQVGR